MNNTRPLLRYSALTALLFASSAGFAAGFSLEEQNAVQTGDFGSGGAAIAEDASTAWYNPAGLIRIDKPEVVLAGNEIWFNTQFNGTINQTAVTGFGPESTGPVPVSNVSGGTANFIPAFHASYPISQNLVAGFSVTTPFGLSTDYGASTDVRYATVETKLKTIDISPSIGIKLSPAFSLGLGFDEQRLLATFESYGGIPALSSSYDTSSRNVASDWAPGWHGGFLYQPNSETRFGLAYHSRITHQATGYSDLTGLLAPNGGVAYDLNNTTAILHLPAKTELSAYHDMNNRWAVMGSLIYTQWDVLQNITINNVASHTGPTSVTIPENFKNTWRVSAGTNYKVNDQWLVRTGIGFDQNPTNSTDRNLMLPDGNRYAISVGGRYQASKNLAVDAGFTHEFILTSGLNYTAVAGSQSTQVSGKSTSSANVLGLQMTYRFA